MRMPRDPQANPSTESAKQRGLGEELALMKLILAKRPHSGARHVPLLCSKSTCSLFAEISHALLVLRQSPL
jgi:hypothetical protein